MASINLQLESCGLVVLEVEGALGVHELIDLNLPSFIKERKLKILWDISMGSVLNLKREDVEMAANELCKVSSKLDMGKIAFVADTGSDYGILRMYQTYVELRNPFITFEIFYEAEDARQWLSLSESPNSSVVVI